MDYWIDAEGENAIWYMVYGGTHSYWNINILYYLGTPHADIYGSINILEEKCPNNEGYVWSWNYHDGVSFTDTNDVYIKCANEDDFCTYENPCVANQGDCDTHDECQDGLLCGSNNCPDSLGFHSEFDCCYVPAIGDEDFCTILNPCGQDEGDCDSQDECQTGLGCGSNNCPDSLGFNSGVDCCYPCHGSCGTPSWKGDNFCDDENNNCGCEWDGGDCCGDNVNTDYCSICQCLDPNAANSKKSQSFNKSLNIAHNKRKISFEHKIKTSMGYSKLKPKLSKMSISRKQAFDLEHEIMTDSLSYSTLLKYKRSRKSHRNLLASKKTLRKPSNTKSSGPTQLKKTHHASSDFGLTVVLNPKVPEYSNALKNSFTGFKTLVHTPYDFAEVDAVGMAIDKNIRAYIGIRGFHSWTTDAANAMDLKHKRCLARTDDLTKYHDIRMDIFANYTKKGCILECYANLYYDFCKCIPYHYPDFTKAWHVNSTTCDYNGLRCLSTVEGNYVILILDRFKHIANNASKFTLSICYCIIDNIEHLQHFLIVFYIS